MKIYQIHVTFHYNDYIRSLIIEKMLKPNTFIKYKHYKNRQGALKKT